jgi:hypothetical protein
MTTGRATLPGVIAELESILAPDLVRIVIRPERVNRYGG